MSLHFMMLLIEVNTVQISVSITLSLLLLFLHKKLARAAKRAAAHEMILIFPTELTLSVISGSN